MGSMGGGAMTMVDRTRNGKPVQTEFVVTATAEHFVTVKAIDEEQARHRAAEALRNRWGVGRNITITEVERGDASG